MATKTPWAVLVVDFVLACSCSQTQNPPPARTTSAPQPSTESSSRSKQSSTPRTMPSAPSFNRSRRCQTQGLYDGGQPTSITVLPAKQDQFCPIILSIKNEYIDWIESGAKTNEYRKRLPADAFSHVVFFNTDTRRIQGFAVVNEVWVGPPQMIADQTWPKSGTDAAGLIEYFGVNRPFGFAILMAGYQNFASRFGDSVASKLSLSSVHELEPTFAAPPSYDFLEKYPQLEMRLHDLMVAQ